MVTYAKKIEKEPETLSERLRHLRQSKEMTQKEFAEIVGCKRSAYANKETDDCGFSVEQLTKLGEYFHMNMNWLFFGEGRMTRK